MSITLSSCSTPVERAVRARRARGASCSLRASAGYRMSLTSDDLPAPETPVTARQHAERESRRRRPCRLFSLRAAHARAMPRGVAALSPGPRCCARPERYAPGRATPAALRELRGRARVHDRGRRDARRRGRSRRPSRRRSIVSSSCSTTSTVLPRSRSRRSVAMQPLVVALVQADRRLVEHVHARPSARCRAGSPAGCAAPRRPTASAPERSSVR